MQIRMCLGAVALILSMHGLLATADADTNSDALADGVLSICADPYIYPSSTQGYPPGYDIEILEAIARTGGYRSDQFWVNSGTIGGLGRALRNSIAGGYCDVFIGVAVCEATTTAAVSTTRSSIVVPPTVGGPLSLRGAWRARRVTRQF